jgi:hypothetical protein
MNRGRLVAALACIVTFGATALAACGGYSDEDAETFCNQEQTALAQCFTASVKAQCLECYKDCGAACDRKSTCPEQYFCNEE